MYFKKICTHVCTVEARRTCRRSRPRRRSTCPGTRTVPNRTWTETVYRRRAASGWRAGRSSCRRRGRSPPRPPTPPTSLTTFHSATNAKRGVWDKTNLKLSTLFVEVSFGIRGASASISCRIFFQPHWRNRFKAFLSILPARSLSLGNKTDRTIKASERALGGCARGGTSRA